jgi:threonine synthase
MDTVTQNSVHWILVATAHPAKFETVVEPLIGEQVPLPPELEDILGRPSHSVAIEASLAAFASALENAFASV